MRARDLVLNGVSALGPHAFTSGRALLLHFDMYCRPSELLGIQPEHIVPPASAVQVLTVILGPRNVHAECSAQDLASAKKGEDRRSGTKTGHFDNSVMIG